MSVAMHCTSVCQLSTQRSTRGWLTDDGWVVDDYITMWPWPLTRWQYIECHVIKRNRTICGWWCRPLAPSA